MSRLWPVRLTVFPFFFSKHPVGGRVAAMEAKVTHSEEAKASHVERPRGGHPAARLQLFQRSQLRHWTHCEGTVWNMPAPTDNRKQTKPIHRAQVRLSCWL